VKNIELHYILGLRTFSAYLKDEYKRGRGREVATYNKEMDVIGCLSLVHFFNLDILKTHSYIYFLRA
jgi:hypothetical protein